MSNARFLAVLSLLAATATATAQDDRTTVASGGTWFAETYGNSLLGMRAMSLRIGIEPTVDVEPITLAWQEPVYITVREGKPGDILQLLVGGAPSSMPLEPIARGVLLVNPAPIAVPGTFDIAGAWSTIVDPNDPSLIDVQVYMQAVSLSLAGASPQLTLSQGLRIVIKGVLDYQSATHDLRPE
jgi:hypothetical protein